MKGVHPLVLREIQRMTLPELGRAQSATGRAPGPHATAVWNALVDEWLFRNASRRRMLKRIGR